MKRFLILPLLLALLSRPALAQPAEARLPLIAVSTYPLQWVCETLAGDQATVVNLTAKADHPRDWVPRDDDLAILRNADLVVLQGGGYERWAENVRGDNLFRSSEAALEAYSELRKLSEEDKALFHLRCGGRAWLDPLHLRLQAREIARRLDGLLPEDTLRRRLETLERELSALENDYRNNERLKRERFLVLEPTLEVTLAPAVGLYVRSVVFTGAPGEPRVPPFSPEALKQVQDRLVDFPARLAISLCAHPLSTDWVDRLQNDFHIWTHRFDTGESSPLAGRNYPALMRQNLSTLTSGLLP